VCIVLQTNRLILRHLTLDDLDDLAILYADPEVRRFFPADVCDRNGTQRLLEEMIHHQEVHGFSLWATVLKETSRLVGRCGLLCHVIDQEPFVEVAYMISPVCQNQGLATEAARGIVDCGFHQLNRSELISLIHPGNIPSRRVAEKTGMVYQRDVEFEGIIHRLYSISRNTWQLRQDTGS